MKSFVDHIFKRAEPRLEKCPQNSTRVILIPTAAGLLPVWLQKEARTAWLDVWTSITNTGLLPEVWESDRWDFFYSFILQRKQKKWMSLFLKIVYGFGIMQDLSWSFVLDCDYSLCPRPLPINLPFWTFIVFRSALDGALLRIKQVELIDTKSKQTFPFPVIIPSWFWGLPGRIDQRASENSPSYCMCTFNKYNLWAI